MSNIPASERFRRMPPWLTGSLLALFSVAASADPPVGFQGFLTDAADDPVNGTINLVISLFDTATGGSALYTESHPAVSISQGRFRLDIGTGSPVTGSFSADLFIAERWVEVNVNGEAMTPRTRLGSVASAQHSVIADRLSLNCADGESLTFLGGLPQCAPSCIEGDALVCYSGNPATRHVGACKDGSRYCSSGSFTSSACSLEILPSAEICNAVDDNCNGTIDEGSNNPGCLNRYADVDGDGSGAGAVVACLCSAFNQAGTVRNANDCDDADATAHPGVAEYFATPSIGGTFDYNCNGVLEKDTTLGVASCTWNGSSCNYQYGFVNSIPACGAYGALSTGCTQNGSSCTVNSGFAGLQVKCH